MGKQKSCDTRRPCHLLTARYGYYDIFFQIELKKLLMFTPKLPTAALRLLTYLSIDSSDIYQTALSSKLASNTC